MKSHTASVAVAPRLKHGSVSTGQVTRMNRQIVMENEALSEALCSLCQDNALVSGKAKLASEV